MTTPSITPVVSFRAIDKAAVTLKLFVKYYFPVYGLEDRHFIEHMELYLSVEAAMYQSDEENEAHVLEDGVTSTAMDTTAELLKARGLYDERLGAALTMAPRYFELEKRVCSGKSFTLEDILEASKLKSLDVHVLHRLTQKLTRGSYDEDLLELFWIGDRLVEIQYDLEQYEDDVERNVLNVYRMFLKLHGVRGKAGLEGLIEDLSRDAQNRILRMPAGRRYDLERSLTAFRSEAPRPDWPVPIASDYLHRSDRVGGRSPSPEAIS